MRLYNLLLAVILSAALCACGSGSAGPETPSRAEAVTPSGDFSRSRIFSGPDARTPGRVTSDAAHESAVTPGVTATADPGARPGPVQKFDRPKEGRMPSKGGGSARKPAAVASVKGAVAPSSGKAASGQPDKAEAPDAAVDRPVAAPPDLPPPPAQQPVLSPAAPVPPPQAPAPASSPIPVRPSAPAQPAVPVQPVVPAQPAVRAQPSTPTGAGQVSSVPAQVPAAPASGSASGGQAGEAAPTPVPPSVPSYEETPEPVIGKRDEVVPLPPVPTIGRIMPPLVPGVPPDADVSANTLPAPEAAPPASALPVPRPADSFGEVIPNFTAPAPPVPGAP